MIVSSHLSQALSTLNRHMGVCVGGGGEGGGCPERAGCMEECARSNSPAPPGYEVIACKHDILAQCQLNARQPSATLAQQ